MHIAQLTRTPDHDRLRTKPFRHRQYFRQVSVQSNDEASQYIPGPPAVLTVTEASAQLRVSRWTLYQLIRSRQLDTIKIGKRRLIPASAILALIERLRGEENL